MNALRPLGWLALAALLPAAASGSPGRDAVAAIDASRPGLLGGEARLALEAERPPAWLAPLDGDGRRRWWIEAEPGWRPPADWAERRRWSSGEVWILDAAPAELERLAAAGGLLSVRPDRLLRPSLDLSLPLVGVDGLHEAPDGPWRGAGTLTGVVDSGIDPLHGDFWDGGRCRILGLWDQLDGRRYDRAALEAGQADLRDPTGHGTHVAGILAGNGDSAPGGPSGGPFVGYAPEAELAVVASTLSESDILAGVEWIFGLADEEGLPCVVNLSLETHLGAHDGASTFENALEALTGPGRLLAVAAGNSGDEPVHHHAGFGRSHGIAFDAVADDDLFVDVWIESAAAPAATLDLPDGSSTGPFAGTRRLAGWTIAFPAPSLERGRWRILLRLERGAAGDGFELGLAWNDDLARRAEAWTSGAAFADPVAEHTLGIPATGDSMLVAGSFVHRASWTAADGRSWGYPGEIAGEPSSFSAFGPRLDGRRLPQAMLPGQGVFSALSRGYALTDGLEPWLHADGQHVLRQGTSMASPALAGCLALALGKDPALTPTLADSLLRRAAGDAWDPQRGHGLLDAAALLDLIAQGLRDLAVEPGLDAVAVGWTLGADWPGGEQRLSRLEEGRADTLLATLPALAGAARVEDGDLTAGRRVRYRVELFDGDGALAGRLASAETGLLTVVAPVWTALGPNPCESGRVRVAWLLPEETELRWTLHDLLGRRLGAGSLGVRPRGAGAAWIELPAAAAGLQLLTLDGVGWSRTRRLLRLDGARP